MKANTIILWRQSVRWSVTAVAGVSRLIGDAADSPIVEDLGDATQLTGALLLGYGF